MARPLSTAIRAALEPLKEYDREIFDADLDVEAERIASAVTADAARLLDALLKDVVDNGAYNALGTGIVERLLEIKAAL